MEFKNGTKVLSLDGIDGCDIYRLSEENGKKSIRLEGWFYESDEQWHFTEIRVDEMPVEEFMKYKRSNAFGYNSDITDMIDNSKQYIEDFATEKDAENRLKEMCPTVLFLADLNEYVPEGVYLSPIGERVYEEKEIGCSAMEVSVPGGKLRATKSTDPMYPSIDVEFIAGAEDRLEGKFLSRPRVLMEYEMEDDTLRAAIWTDEKSEDYSEDVVFNKHYYK